MGTSIPIWLKILRQRLLLCKTYSRQDFFHHCYRGYFNPNLEVLATIGTCVVGCMPSNVFDDIKRGGGF